MLQVAIARFEQDAALRAQLEKAEQQLAGRKLIERAKGVLMSEAGLGEDEAYRRLRRLAMDRGKRLAEVAQSVLDAQDLLWLVPARAAPPREGGAGARTGRRPTMPG